MSDWIETQDTRGINDLTVVMVRNRFGQEFGPILWGMISSQALDGGHFHGSCDIPEYKVVGE